MYYKEIKKEVPVTEADQFSPLSTVVEHELMVKEDGWELIGHITGRIGRSSHRPFQNKVLRIDLLPVFNVHLRLHLRPDHELAVVRLEPLGDLTRVGPFVVGPRQDLHGRPERSKRRHRRVRPDRR